MKADRSKIRAFLAKFIKKQNIEDDDDIFARGFVNSLFAMQIVLFVETEFSITIEREDLKLDNFRSISALAGLIDQKRNSSVPS